MELGRIERIYRYPVKSMGGEVLEQATLASNGIPGDRAWAVRDEVRGGIRGAKKIPGLMGCSARFTDEPQVGSTTPAQVTLPDGSSLRTTDDDAAARVSEAVGHSVSLWPLLPAEELDHYRRGAPDHDDLETELRELFGRTADEPLPDLSVFPPDILEYESPPGTYFDVFPLLLMTEASLASLQALAPDSVFDVRRFRPNFLIGATGDGESFPEVGWENCRIRIGEAQIRTTVVCPRCVMTTHGFDNLPRDPKVMRALVREAGGSLGVYASVEKGGMIRHGDAVTLVERIVS